MRALFSAMVALGAGICVGFPAAAQHAEPARVGLLSLHSLEQEIALGTGASAFEGACKLSVIAKATTSSFMNVMQRGTEHGFNP